MFAKKTGALPLLLMLGFTACSTAPVSFNGITPTGPGDSYSCAIQQLNALGYTVEDADREAGFVRGRKQTSGLGTAILTGSNYHDVLTISVFRPVDGQQTRMRATAARIEEQALGFGRGNDTGVAPSDQGKADASTVLEACRATDIVQGEQD